MAVRGWVRRRAKWPLLDSSQKYLNILESKTMELVPQIQHRLKLRVLGDVDSERNLEPTPIIIYFSMCEMRATYYVIVIA